MRTLVTVQNIQAHTVKIFIVDVIPLMSCLLRSACVSHSHTYCLLDEQNGDRGAGKGRIADKRRVRSVYRKQ
jgi:hypothetical protein